MAKKRYLKVKSTKMKLFDKKKSITLIWGDLIHVEDDSTNPALVRARGIKGWLSKTLWSKEKLLELYIIDVGQGDGILMKTPNDKWHLIDAGVANRSQMTKKGTANFLRWKFKYDLRKLKVKLENAVMSHADYDHYGGFINVFSGKLYDVKTGKMYASPAFDIEVENFYHPGMAKFKASPKLGKTKKGETVDFPYGYNGIQTKGTFITELLTGKGSFGNPSRPFQTTFKEFADLVATVPQNVKRLSFKNKYLPGYLPSATKPSIRVLGPILENFDGKQGLRKLGSDSKSVNGHSIILRVDYGDARILLTGDLNRKSQKLLKSYLPDDDFKTDVVKGCHHGSEDVDVEFISAVAARATVISSGDNEDYAHPRPILMGASARYGRESFDEENNVMAPLLYSTELARSVKLSYAKKVKVDCDKNPNTPMKSLKPSAVKVNATSRANDYRNLQYMPMSVDLIYGLVNIRTDGKEILCATMEEKGSDFDIKVFKAGKDVPLNMVKDLLNI